MKRFLIFSIAFFSFFLLSNFVFPQDIIIGTNVQASEFSKIVNFLSSNWQIIALIASEVAALIPGKINGLIHAVLKIGTSIFSHINNKT